MASIGPIGRAMVGLQPFVLSPSKDEPGEIKVDFSGFMLRQAQHERMS